MSDSGQEKDPFESIRKQLQEMQSEGKQPAAPSPSPLQNESITEEDHLEVERQAEELEKKARAIRSRNPHPEPGEWKFQNVPSSKNQKAESNHYKGLALGLTLAYAFIGPTIAGYGIGWYLDHIHGQTNVDQTWGTLIGLFAGFIGAVFLLMRSNR